MKKRNRLLLLAGAAIVVLVAAALLLRPRADRINYANFLRIDEHMRRDEVEAILGSPNFSAANLQKMGSADFYRRMELDWESFPFPIPPPPPRPGAEQHWISREVAISIRFTNGRVVRKVCLQRGGPLRRLMNDWMPSR
jgi:hypothetical protein